MLFDNSVQELQIEVVKRFSQLNCSLGLVSVSVSIQSDSPKKQ